MIVVTGAAGFIGSNLARALNLRGRRDLVLVDDLEQGEKHLNLNGLEFADYLDVREFLADLPHQLRHAELVLHQGACADTTERNGRLMMERNYGYSKALLGACMEHKVRLIYASSAAVYGDGAHGFREARACEWPLNVYGFSKLLFDRHVRQVSSRARSQVVGLRYFNVYGPQENHKGRMASVVFHFHEQLVASGECRPFEGSERFRRDFVHVDDVTAVVLHFVDRPETSGIFNCGTGRAESFMEIARLMAPLYPKAVIRPVPFPADLVGKYQEFTQADLGMLRDAGCDVAFRPLASGVPAYVAVLQKTGGFYR
jgi:ADP-L-glycero-D-manno-heptose 6-epimerase